ncbi:stearoyl-coa desaturase 5-like [Dermatophagoides farinae]|uniref:Stearoyl-coa desaturase 5-like n=1 Tax=Dermatophagoides farinae TaxID=6954 RepID=A0A9D4SDV3_DERFA|nr:stearoyl-CoA desaturase 5-like [Dermatophagoides farinae]KAH7638046.1 stearoyl-coa desaturase 5-like [Dermatophagoides farinae]
MVNSTSTICEQLFCDSVIDNDEQKFVEKTMTMNFDNKQQEQQQESDNDNVYRRQIVWRNVIAMTILHLMAIYSYIYFGLDRRITWYVLFWPDILARISALGVLAGSHRLWSHRSYRARLPLRIFLMILQTMALQNDIYDWCRDHRLHHKHSDTNADPYNARRGFFFSHMGWLMVRKHPDVIRKGKTIDLTDVWADPVVRFQRRFYIPLVLLIWGILPTYFCHYVTGYTMVDCFLGAVIVRYVLSLHYAWLVNSAAHLYGYKMYDQSMEPRENRMVVYASMGEGYHNYHHTFPWDYSASEHGWSECFNITTAFIDLCVWLGLAYGRKKANEKIIQKRIERTGNRDYYRKYYGPGTLADYSLGILSSYGFLFITWTLRYLINGQL